jgi:ABC-type transport system substrate-binding protein
MNQISNQPGINVITNPTNGFRYLSFNVRKAPMSDKVFRQAFACMINKEFITNNVLQGVAFPIYTEVPEANGFWFNPNVNKGCQGKTDEERVTMAVQMLETAGYKWEGDKKPTWDKDNRRVQQGGALLMPDGKPVPTVSLIAPSAGYDPLRSSFAIWIERYANDLGVPLKAELIGFNELITRVYEDPEYATKLDMYILGWSLTLFPDYLYDFHGSRFAGPGDNNAGGFNNAKLDELGDQLKSCLDLEVCKKIANDLQVLISEELPYIVLFDTGIVETYRSSVNYPYTETLSGLQFVEGLQESVTPANQ